MDVAVPLQLPPPEEVSEVGPTDADAAQDVAVKDLLHRTYNAGGPDTSHQVQALRRLHAMFRDWIAPTEFLMFVSGSYRMNVHTHDSDIDVVLVVPASVPRPRLFAGFGAVLQAAEGVTELQVIPNARVPLIGLVLDGQEFDIMTCHLPDEHVPLQRDILQSYEWMNGMDEASILAFNGPRVTEMLLRSVPDATAFCTAVKFLRLWAKRRGVYSNKSGFLGGVNIALLACYVARRHPLASAAMLVRLTFQVFSQWKWGRRAPVQLDETVKQACPVWLAAHEWSPTARSREEMVILTPCFPRFNSSYSACPWSAKIMRLELDRAARLVDAGTADWPALVCAPLDVFNKCMWYIRMRLVSTDTPSGRLWMGYMESQVRHLVQYLSNEDLGIAMFRYVPVWVAVAETDPETDPVADPVVVARCKEAYITADHDGVKRTYQLRGDIQRALTYFMATYADAGPARPAESTMDVKFIPRSEVSDTVFDVMNTPRKSDAEVLAALTSSRATGGGGGSGPPPHAKTLPAPGTGTGTGTVACMSSSSLSSLSLSRAAPVPSPAGAEEVALRPKRRLRYVPGPINNPTACRPPPLAPPPPPPPPPPPRVARLFWEQGRLTPSYDVYIGPPWRHLQPAPWLHCDLRREDFPTPDAWLDAWRTQLELRVATNAQCRRDVASLGGKVLGCWCAPLPCHGDVIAQVWRKLCGISPEK